MPKKMRLRDSCLRRIRRGLSRALLHSLARSAASGSKRARERITHLRQRLGGFRVNAELLSDICGNIVRQ